jgi:RimJ/RimL family protein N-acetyltransferase
LGGRAKGPKDCVTEVPTEPVTASVTVDGVTATQNSAPKNGELVDFGEAGEAVVRPICAADARALVRFHGHLSEKSVRLRYFSPHEELSASEVAHLTQVDGEDRVAFVVERAGELIAVGRYDRLTDQKMAEVAFVVADSYQHQGLATMLLRRLANAARPVGITRFVAEVLAENRAMLSVLHDAGFPIESEIEWGTVTLFMFIGSDPEETATY